MKCIARSHSTAEFTLSVRILLALPCRMLSFTIEWGGMTIFIQSKWHIWALNLVPPNKQELGDVKGMGVTSL